MAYYTNEYSRFPSQVMELREYKDMDDTVAATIHDINRYREAGQYALAANLAAQNAEVLRDYNFSAADVNWLIEEIRNAQIYSKAVQQSIIFSTEEPEISEYGDVWVDMDLGDDS